jgi:hypothetical protein
MTRRSVIRAGGRKRAGQGTARMCQFPSVKPRQTHQNWEVSVVPAPEDPGEGAKTTVRNGTNRRARVEKREEIIF